MTRREARETLFKLIYERPYHKEEAAEDTLARELEELGIDDSYVADGFKGTFDNIDEIDGLISENSIGWKINRLSKVSHAIMRLACYEMLYTDLPVNIAINEAVELAKKYDHDQAPSFINGILNTIANKKGLKDKPENA